MPPKRAASGTKTRAASAGSAKGEGGRKKKSNKKKVANTGPVELPPPTLEEMVSNVTIPKPFAGILSDTGSAIYSVAVADWPAQEATTGPVAPTKLVLSGSYNGVINVLQCAPRPSTKPANGRLGGGGDALSDHDFDGSGSPFSSPTSAAFAATTSGTAAAPPGRPSFDSTQAAAAAGLGTTLLLPQNGAAPLYPIKAQSLPAHSNIIKQLLVCSNIRSIAGKAATANTSHPQILPSLPEPSSEGVVAQLQPQMLLSCSVDGTIKLWSLPDCTLKAVYTTVAAKTTAALAAAPPTLAPTLVDKARSAIGNEVSKTTTFLTEAIQNSSPTGKASQARNGTSDADDAEVPPTQGDKKAVATSTFNAMCLGPEDSNKLYACDDEGYVHCWDLLPLKSSNSNATAAGESPQSPTAEMGTSPSAADTFLPNVSLKVHRGRVTALCVPVVDRLLFPEGPHSGTPELPPANSSVITVSDEGLGKLINIATRKVLSIYVCESGGETQYAPTEPAVSVAFRHPNVIIGCMDGSIQVFNISTARRVAKWQGHADSVNRLLLTKPFVTGPTTAHLPPPPVKVYSKKQLQKLAMTGTPVPPPAPPPVHTQLPAEAHLLISCGDDRSIALWDCTTWSPIFYFTTPSASLSRFRRPLSARFQSTTAGIGLGAGTYPLPPTYGSPANSTEGGLGQGADPLVFGHRTAAGAASSSTPVYHKHSISDIALDPAALTEFTLSMLKAANAMAATATAPASNKPSYAISSSAAATGAQLEPTVRGGGGLLMSACFGGKILMWDYQSIVGSLDQRQRLQYNSISAAKAKARAEAVAEKNKQNQRGGSAKGRR